MTCLVSFIESGFEADNTVFVFEEDLLVCPVKGTNLKDAGVGLVKEFETVHIVTFLVVDDYFSDNAVRGVQADDWLRLARHWRVAGLAIFENKVELLSSAENTRQVVIP